MARKIIQIDNFDSDGCSFRALCDDGSLWEANWAKRGEDKKHRWYWDSIPNVPQEIKEQNGHNAQHSNGAEPQGEICGKCDHPVERGISFCPQCNSNLDFNGRKFRHC